MVFHLYKELDALKGLIMHANQANYIEIVSLIY